MMIPGRMLHRLAVHICSTHTLEQVIEPAIADLQKEFAGAEQFARRGWILVTGYLAIAKVMALCAASVSLENDADRRAFVTAIVWSAAMVAAFVLLLMVPPLIAHPRWSWLVTSTLFPQAIGVAVPIGIAFGIAFGVSGRAPLNLAKAILAVALVLSVLNFANLAWGVPAANQAFNTFTFRELSARGYEGPPQTLFQKGRSELTLTELQTVIAHFSADGEPRIARQYAFAFHMRFALAAATLALASMLLVVRADTRAARGAFAFAACVIYWVLMFGGEWGARRGYLIPPLGAWLPNLVLIALSVYIASSRSSRLRDETIPAR